MATGTATGTGSDPVRDLNNYLQEVNKGENLTKDLTFSTTDEQTGENNQVIHTGRYTFRTVTIGMGKGTSKAAARRVAATKGLEYLKANGIPPHGTHVCMGLRASITVTPHETSCRYVLATIHPGYYASLTPCSTLMKIAAIGTWKNVTNCPAATPLGTSYPTMWLVGNLYLRWRAGTYPQTFVPKLKLVSCHPAGNGGNATRDFEWVLKREGPEHCTTYHVTAVFRGVNVGVGHGSTKGIAKRNASIQALEYLKTHVPPGL
ncbi:hypothetical protein BGY98DRAFT_936372 [Russula aff. rugulosa BPL654]|nr:hypothetical protein BGY98DRAFT_936372 [Russula aff. rugulosa BPL654]